MLIEAVTEMPIPVSSQDRTLAFYAGTPGLELVRADDSVLGVRWIRLTPSGGAPVLTLARWLDSMPPGCLRELVFRSGNVQADYHRLVAAGVECLRNAAAQGRYRASDGPGGTIPRTRLLALTPDRPGVSMDPDDRAGMRSTQCKPVRRRPCRGKSRLVRLRRCGATR